MDDRATERIRVYDAFLFDGELDLLEHRLRQNFDATDVFILVEAGETYRGAPKPFVFSQNRSRFAWADAKIRAVRLDTLGPPASSARDRAAVQRNALLLALYDASPDDVVLLLDADEIPSLKLLEDLGSQGLAEPHRLEMTRHYQRINLLAPASTCCVDRSQPFEAAANRSRVQSWRPGAQWSGRSGVAVSVRYLRGDQGRSPYQWRFSTTINPVLAESGRHLTAVDPSAHLARKMGRVFHTEWATGRGMYPPHLARCEQHAVHHRGWWYAEVVPGELPPDLAALARATPATVRTGDLPAIWRRRCVRTWAWLRTSPRFTDQQVRAIDDRFDRWLPWLAPILLALDAGRFLAGEIFRRTRKTSGGKGT